MDSRNETRVIDKISAICIRWQRRRGKVYGPMEKIGFQLVMLARALLIERARTAKLRVRLEQAMAWVPEGTDSCLECRSLCPPLGVYRPCKSCHETLCGTCGLYIGGLGDCCTKCHEAQA